MVILGGWAFLMSEGLLYRAHSIIRAHHFDTASVRTIKNECVDLKFSKIREKRV
jgi:hypothetical protein